MFLTAPQAQLLGNSSVMDVTFGHKMTNKISQKNYSSYMTIMLMPITIAPTWLRGRGKTNYTKSFVKPEKNKQITLFMVMDVVQKDRYFLETVHFLIAL